MVSPDLHVGFLEPHASRRRWLLVKIPSATERVSAPKPFVPLPSYG